MQLNWPIHTPTMLDIITSQSKYVTGQGNGAYVIYCYNKGAFFEGFNNTEEVWTDLTRNCRGLVYTTMGKPVARGFPKFFNLGENIHSQWNPDYDNQEQYQLHLIEKYNGFCCHIWKDQRTGELRFTTKGAAEHDFENYGQQLWEKQLRNGFPTEYQDILDNGGTILAEAIHPDDPHTIKYPEGLYYLAHINPELNTLTVDLTNFPGEHHQISNIEEGIKHQQQAPHEGYVLYVTDHQGNVANVYKLKSPTYINKRLARRQIEQLTNNHELFANYQLNKDEITFNYEPVKETLDEFYDDWYAVRNHVVTSIQQELQHHHNEAKLLLKQDTGSRKELAALIKDTNPALMQYTMLLRDNHVDRINTYINTSLLSKIYKQVKNKENN